PPRAVPVGSLDCGRTPGWVEYTVQPGDTLSSLSLRTGVDVGTLMQANCLTSDTIYAGRLLYLARFPAKPAGGEGTWPPYQAPKPIVGWPPAATPAPPSGGGAPLWPTKPAGPPPTLAPLPFPTTWYTPPPPAPAPGDVGGDAAGNGPGGGAGAAPPSGPGAAAPAPYVPPAPAATRIPDKDPNRAEPTLAPRPMP
ncbi:MAG: LysM peptidoglycan-binding domain-containing protein, partial [Ardenticatenales bacterium]